MIPSAALYADFDLIFGFNNRVNFSRFGGLPSQPATLLPWPFKFDEKPVNPTYKPSQPIPVQLDKTRTACGLARGESLSEGL